MSLLGKLLYKYYYGPRNLKATVESYGGQEKYDGMKLEEVNMKMFALNSLSLNFNFSKHGKYHLNFLTGEKFIHQSLFCVFSFFKQLSDKEASMFSVTFFDDGTLSGNIRQILREKFPNIDTIGYHEAMNRVETRFPKEKYPFINRKKKELFFFNKIFFLHSGEEKFQIYLDSDMLFMKRPNALMKWLYDHEGKDGSAFAIHDIMQSYGYNQTILNKVAGKSVNHQINAGFYGISTSSIDFDYIENLIETLENNYGEDYYMEQFITSLILSNNQLTLLPKNEYIVWPTPEQVLVQEGTLHHYVSTSKLDYFTQAWKKIIG